jgi:hypothetical protein
MPTVRQQEEKMIKPHTSLPGVTPVTGAQAVFGKLTNTHYKRLVQIGEGTHLVFLEKNRMHLFREVQSFLDEPRSAN